MTKEGVLGQRLPYGRNIAIIFESDQALVLTCEQSKRHQHKEIPREGSVSDLGCRNDKCVLETDGRNCLNPYVNMRLWG